MQHIAYTCFFTNFKKSTSIWWFLCWGLCAGHFIHLSKPPCQRGSAALGSLCNNYGLNICLEGTTAFDEEECITVTQPWTIMHKILYSWDQWGLPRAPFKTFRFEFSLEIGGFRQGSVISPWNSKHLENCGEGQAENRTGVADRGLGNCQSHPESTAVGAALDQLAKPASPPCGVWTWGWYGLDFRLLAVICSSSGKAMQEKPPEDRETKGKLRRGILTATERACDCTLSKSAVQCQPYLGSNPFPSLIPSGNLVSILSHLACPQTVSCPPRATPMVEDWPINSNASLRDSSKCASQCIRR